MTLKYLYHRCKNVSTLYKSTKDKKKSLKLKNKSLKFIEKSYFTQHKIKISNSDSINIALKKIQSM